MSVEQQYFFSHVHNRCITAVGYNPARREILVGCEDGFIKIWDVDDGRQTFTHREHNGWVTDFLYWPEMKAMISSSNDGYILVWGSGGSVIDFINIKQPIYKTSLLINSRKKQLLCGLNCAINSYDLDIEKGSGHFIDTLLFTVSKQHTDIVKCLIGFESRVFSAGYDGKLLVYDSSYTRENYLKPIAVRNTAHLAGIVSLSVFKDSEKNVWIVTGSFDRTIKIWTGDAIRIHTCEDASFSNVTSVCYIGRTLTLWVAAGGATPEIFDAKSGENITEFLTHFQRNDDDKYSLQLLYNYNEIIIGSTSRRSLVVWKYTSTGCLSNLKTNIEIECLAYTNKVPMLIFSSDQAGVITKWERKESNHFMYTKEHLNISDAKRIIKIKKFPTSDEQSQSSLTKNTVIENGKRSTAILRTKFVEELDYLIATCEDGNVYVWGFDLNAVSVLKNMKFDKPPTEETESKLSKEENRKKYEIILENHNESDEINLDRLKCIKQQKLDDESVTNRVAGFTCRHIFCEHKNIVTSLAILPYTKTIKEIVADPEFDGFKEISRSVNHIFALTAGWDRRICVWDLNDGQLQTVFRDPINGGSELASDGEITDLDYAPGRNLFAYSSTDKLIYVRQFNLDGRQMKLENTLQGHFSDVTCINWSAETDRWVSGSEDGTVRVWSADGMRSDDEETLNVGGSVHALCIDKINSAIIVGVDEVMKIYEIEKYRLVQTNYGHTLNIRDILHMPERDQYISVSWDCTMRLWNAWKKPKKILSQRKKDESNVFSMLKQGRITADQLDEII